ncbi:DUF2834 domain-containing protein [Palleronia abyssalis]|uniref:K+-transporting ATPase, A chain n=1 Tax=Palleronia abyssalis TaxID=1501240 RepID=A0A2R8BX44_9RHOB|nr:DUF2834 domain-containing protein [Palleronia abyssalis]SPJ24703.1 hypothetical protein PAA8504_02541 [Palleronia abyssalis]
MRWVFLALAVWGAVHPMYWFLAYMNEGHGFGALIEAWYVNASTTGLAWDLTISALTLTLWIAWDSVTSRDWLGLIAIPAIFGIGVSCALPLYLFLRTRPARAALPKAS